jgi:hypothetical protein
MVVDGVHEVPQFRFGAVRQWQRAKPRFNGDGANI